MSSSEQDSGSVPTMSLSTSISPSDPSHPSYEVDDGNTHIRISNKLYGGSRIRISKKLYGGSHSVPTMSLSTSILPSDEVEDGNTISIHMYGGAAAAVILVVTVVMIIILACVLQQRRSKKAVNKEQTNEYYVGKCYIMSLSLGSLLLSESQ